ncbi:MAG: acetate kinase [Cyanobacteria bacterium J06643_4]
MKILVLNAGSSSQKSCLYNIADNIEDNIEDNTECNTENALPEQPSEPLSEQLSKPLWEAQIDWLPQQQSARIEIQTSAGKQQSETRPSVSRKETLAYLLSCLHQGDTQVISSLADIDIVGHRVVHGGQDYQSSVIVNAEVKATIDRLSVLAPNHNPANLEGIELMEQLLGDIPQVAVFDTAFHSQMPAVAAIYPGPNEWLAQGIRRYGFHGISHQYCAYKAAKILGQPLDSLRLIICHLGNGGSLSAVKEGRSVDTTMGFTPLDGLMMGTRAGSVDPGILIYLMRQGKSADELDRLLNKQSGLAGISGVSHDMREISQAAAQGNERAALAMELYIHRLKACFGSMLMSLGGVDAVVFTAGIGEHSPWVREKLCKGLAFLGLTLDAEANKQSPVDRDIAMAKSAVRVLVIKTQEDWAIAQACWDYLKSPAASQSSQVTSL